MSGRGHCCLFQILNGLDFNETLKDGALITDSRTHASDIRLSSYCVARKRWIHRVLHYSAFDKIFQGIQQCSILFLERFSPRPGICGDILSQMRRFTGQIIDAGENSLLLLDVPQWKNIFLIGGKPNENKIIIIHERGDAAVYNRRAGLCRWRRDGA